MNRILPAIILALLLSAAGCLIAGIAMLFGPGWALVSAAPCLLGLSFVFALGMKRNGG